MRHAQAGGELHRIAGGPRRELVGEPGQFLDAALAQARGGHLADAAEDHLDREVLPALLARLRLHPRFPSRGARPHRRRRRGGAVAADANALLERLERVVAAFDRLRSRAEGAEHHQRHRLRRARRQLGKGADRRLQAAVRGIPCVLHLVGRDHRLRGALRDLVVGGEEQLFLVVVQAVEGRARDPRELRQVEDADGLVAALGDQLDDRALQALALVALDLLGVDPVRARRQAPVALTGRFGDATTKILTWHRARTRPPQKPPIDIEPS